VVGGASEMRRDEPPGGPSRFVPARSRAPLGPTDDGCRHGQICWAPFGPAAVDRLSFGNEGSLKRYFHRGRSGANLINTARGTPWRRRSRGQNLLDKPRCREASRPVGPRTLVCALCVNLSASGPVAFRAPSLGARKDWKVACPGPCRAGAWKAKAGAKNRG